MAGVQELVWHIDEVILWLSFRIADLSTHTTKDSSGRHSTEQTSKTRRSKTSVLRSALVPDTLALSVSCFQPMCLYHCSHFPSRVAASGQLKCQQHKVLIRVHSCSLRSKIQYSYLDLGFLSSAKTEPVWASTIYYVCSNLGKASVIWEPWKILKVQFGRFPLATFGCAVSSHAVLPVSWLVCHHSYANQSILLAIGVTRVSLRENRCYIVAKFASPVGCAISSIENGVRMVGRWTASACNLAHHVKTWK